MAGFHRQDLLELYIKFENDGFPDEIPCYVQVLNDLPHNV